MCSRVFDNDYRKEHNNKYPEYQKQNKLVPYETLGAPKNSFEVAKRKQGRFETNIDVIKYFNNNNKRMQQFLFRLKQIVEVN